MAAGSLMGGGIRLFRLFGIEVYLHWLWFVVAIYEIQERYTKYSSIGWNIAEYLALFLIVLMHEFGHALACRSVGGQANRILLWPFGGVAYVSPPPRPGAILWSIVAGPLVNVILAPITIGLYILARDNYFPASPDLFLFFYVIAGLNVGLFIFNMLPIYPLDGGQIFRSLLWFVIGRAKSLYVAGATGLLGAIAFGAWAMTLKRTSTGIWLVLLAALGIWQSWVALKHARALAQFERLPRHESIACPSCKASPPAVPLWRCECGARFDMFQTRATCPACGKHFEETLCPNCGVVSPYTSWKGVQTLPPPLPRSVLHIPAMPVNSPADATRR